jgi:hypothetical protein
MVKKRERAPPKVTAARVPAMSRLTQRLAFGPSPIRYMHSSSQPRQIYDLVVGLLEVQEHDAGGVERRVNVVK